MKITKKRRLEIVASIREYAKSENKHDRPTWRRIAKLLEQEKYKEAYEEFRHADTYVRDGFSGEQRRFIELMVNPTENKKFEITVMYDIFSNGDCQKAKYTVELPAHLKEYQAAMSLNGFTDDIIKNTVKFEIKEIKNDQ